MNIIFAGTPEFSLPALQALIASEHNICAVYTQPDRPAGRGRKIKVSPIKQGALDNNLAIEQPINFKHPDELKALNAYQPDLIIVVAYGIILPEKVLKTPTYGCINIHASLLPTWRGAAPIQRAILNGDEKTGITLMQMDKGLDTGDILVKSICPIDHNDTSASLHSKLSTLGADVLIDLLPNIENKTLTPIQQVPTEASYAEKLSKQEALLDWNRPAEELHRAVRAFNPWPVCHTTLKGKPLRIWQANLVTINATEKPGSISVADGKLYVACAEGQLEITELQAANKRKMPTADFLASQNLDKLCLG
ncbi:MAG: methionyl-tRNA formyltransferase [Piscirickettsiaceae bacterium]|nr:MAG: methionyl-tRNA formyltransferase [Piscirickettsiaceae bacterium]